VAKRNSSKKSGKSLSCASDTVIKQAELNSIYRIVSGKLVDDFIVRSSNGNKDYMQTVFHEVSLPFQLSDGYKDVIITDEMVQRVLAPVLWMIRDGKFDRPSKI